MNEWLTYKQAAKRVGRSVRTIKRWRRSGMPMSFNVAGERIVELATLQTWFRARLEAWPTHQYRMRSRTAGMCTDASTEEKL